MESRRLPRALVKEGSQMGRIRFTLRAPETAVLFGRGARKSRIYRWADFALPPIASCLAVTQL